MAPRAEELETLEEVQMATRRAIAQDSEEGLPRYFRTIGRIALLTAKEEGALAQAIEKGAAASAALSAHRPRRIDERERLHHEVEDGDNARIRLIEGNLRLVVSVARRYVNRGLPIEDLIQAGNLGLLRAVEKFDYRLGFRFSTYATWWVRQAVTRTVADHSRTIRVPAHLQEAFNRIVRYGIQISQTEGREATLDELSPIAGLAPERLREIYRVLPQPASLDIPLGDEQDVILADFVPDDNVDELDTLADRQYLSAEIHQALTDLTEREQLVLGMRYGLDGESEKTLDDIGRVLGVTRERARQIEAGALRKLRQPCSADRLRAFLN